MSYYIAKDRFGNLDLCHYGVKGMKWGVVNLEDSAPINSARSSVSKAQADGQKRTAQLKGTSGKTYSGHFSSGQAAAPAGVSPKNAKEIAKAAESMPVVQEPKNMEDIPVTAEEKKLDDQIADANVKYQTELMRMQMLSRACLANGVTPSADPEYLSARKEVIKAKYELDQLKLKQQQAAAENPPTYAESKERVDSQAKEQLKEDKEKAETKKKSSGSSTTNLNLFDPKKSYSGRK